MVANKDAENRKIDGCCWLAGFRLWGIFFTSMETPPPDKVSCYPGLDCPVDIATEPNPSPPPPSPPQGNSTDTVDRILEKLEFGNIAFNVPRLINIDDATTIHLLLGLATPINELKKLIDAAGEKESARIQISNRMAAHLSGPSFNIIPVTPEVQAVTQTNVNAWMWEIVPKKVGHHNLHLTLSVLITVNGDSTLKSIRTFSKKIEVEVTWDQQVGSFFNKNWQWLWAAILVPIAVWLWKKRKAAKPTTNDFDG